MNISEKLTEQKLQSILLNVYQKGQETENIKVTDIIEDIKIQLLSVNHENV